MPIVPKARAHPSEARAFGPSITGTNPHRATRAVGKPEGVRRVGLPICGHPLPWEAQILYGAWEPGEGETPPEWLCPACKDWRYVNVYPDSMTTELLY